LVLGPVIPRSHWLTDDWRTLCASATSSWDSLAWRRAEWIARPSSCCQGVLVTGL
jgi:hypothetical protein